MKALEDLETEALIRKWGLDEEVFQNSPCFFPVGFESPIEPLPEDRFELPTWRRLWNFYPYQGSLIMQVSIPVMLPVGI